MNCGDILFDDENILIEKSKKIFCDNYKINENYIETKYTNIKINKTQNLFMKPYTDEYISSCFWIKTNCNGFFVFTELQKNDYIYKNFENNNIIICFNFINIPVFFNNKKYFKFIPTETFENDTELLIIDFYNTNAQNIKNPKITIPAIKIQMKESQLDYDFFNLLLYSDSETKIQELIKDFDKKENYNLFFYNKNKLLNDSIDEINKGISATNRFNQRFYNNSFIDKHISNWIHNHFENIDCDQNIISPSQHDSIFYFFLSIFNNIISTIQKYYSITETVQLNIIELIFTKNIETLQNQISSDLFFLIVLFAVHNPNSEKISFVDGMSYDFNDGDMLIINKNDNYYFSEKTKVEYIQLYIDLNNE